MNVCYVATTTHLSAGLDEGIGSTIHTYSVAKELQKKGHNAIIVSDRFENDKKIETIDGIKVYRLLRGVVASSKKIKKSKLNFLLKKLRVFSTIKLGIKIAKIMRENNCNAILERAQSRGAGAIASYLTGKPLFLETIDDINSPLSLYRAKRIFSNSAVFFNETEKKKLTIVNAGFYPEFFRPLNARQSYDLCYCGSFKDWDGLEDLIEAIKILNARGKKVNALLIGNANKFREIKKLVHRNNLEGVIELKGKIPVREVAKEISRARICIAPYNIQLSKEKAFKRFGFFFSPLKVLEYMACGKPVIATNYPIIANILSKKSGLLFEEGSQEELAEKIGSLLESNDLDRIGEYNAKISSQYTWEKVVGIYENEMLREAVQ